MRWLGESWRRLVFLVRRRALERELDEEMQFHLESQAQVNREAGMPGDEAWYTAQRGFGNALRLRESSSEVWGWGPLERTLQDIRLGVRTLRRSPAFATAAILTLALGIGANSAIFTVVHGALIKPLPYPAAERLVWIFESSKRFLPRTQATEVSYAAWRDQARSFDAVSAFTSTAYSLTGSGEAEEVAAAAASPDLFTLLGVAAYRGRFFTAAENVPGRNQLAVITHDLWRRRFGGDEAVVGRQMVLSGKPFTIVGVLPPRFAFRPADPPAFLGLDVHEPDVWVPLSLQASRPSNASSRYYLGILARRRPGVSIEQAQAEANAIVVHATDGRSTCEVASLQAELSKDVRRPLLLLLGAVVLVLLVACANVAHLQLARGMAREPEMAIRAALGAGRGRLLHQLLVESAVLASAGALAGLGVAWCSLRLLAGVAPRDVTALSSFDIDLPVLLFTAGLAGLAMLLFGVVPAIHVSGAHPARGLRGGQRTGAVAPRRRLTNALVAGEVALALALVASAGLMLNTLWRLARVEPGFRTDHALVVRVSLPWPAYTAAKSEEFFQQALDRVRALPGVEAAEAANTLPMGGAAEFAGFFPPGTTNRDLGSSVKAQLRVVTPGYFRGMGIALRKGRLFTAADTQQAPRVVIVNETNERRYFGGQAIGKQFAGNSGEMVEVVGVVADVRHVTLRSEPLPEIYYPFAQLRRGNMWLAVRFAGDPGMLATAIRKTVAALEPNAPIAGVKTMEERRAQSLGTSPLLIELLVAFAGVALALALIGGYGVVNYSVARRTQEFGIRMALGASGSAVIRMVVRETLWTVLAAVVAGLALAFATTRLLSGYLFGVKPTDPATLSIAAALILSAAMVAAWLAARRAARIDPVSAVRAE